MDPICHTLVGAALAETGLKKRSRFGAAALIIGANLPDIDVLAMFLGNNASFEARRGITHGVVGVIVLPIVLALVLKWIASRRPDPGQRVDLRALLLLAYVGTLTHPALDWLNVYGVRLLMPFSETWYQGDALFIVDPLLWLFFSWGVATARKKRKQGRVFWGKPARASLVVASVYIVSMVGMARIFRSMATSDLATVGIAPERIMLGPVPLNPFRRWVVVESDASYRVGVFNLWGEPRLDLYDVTIPVADDSPAARRASLDPGVRRFLDWARFPYFTTEERIGGVMVRVGDARYTVDPQDSWAATQIWIPVEHTVQTVSFPPPPLFPTSRPPDCGGPEQC